MTEGQWSYINKVFFENDCRHRKYSLRSIFEAVRIFLSAVANGVCFHTIFPNGRPFTSTSTNGGWSAILIIV